MTGGLPMLPILKYTVEIRGVLISVKDFPFFAG